MIRAWIDAGRPAWSGHPLGSFEAWSRIAGGILETCGVTGFMENYAELFETSNADGEAWRRLVHLWAEKVRDRFLRFLNAIVCSDPMLSEL
jgi:hypothetical protein